MKVSPTVMVIASLLFVQQSFGQASYKIPITLTNGTNSTVLHLGVNSGNTIGIDTSTTLGTFREVPAPPAPPAPFEWDARFVTIPGRPSIFPIGLAGGVLNDIRGYVSPTQVDSFKIVIAGDATDNATTTVSWPSGLATYGTAWTLKPQVGTDWPSTDMLTSSSVAIGAGLNKNIIIIKVGASGTNDVKHANEDIPTAFALSQNYPNPFNPTTQIQFSIPVAGRTSLRVFNILGQEVATLVNDMRNAGTYTVSFDASTMPSGIYVYRLESLGKTLVNRMTLVK